MNKTQTKQSKRFIFYIIFGCVLILIALAQYLIYSKYFQVTFQQSELTETTDELHNPDCGWYHLYGYMLSDESNITAESILQSVSGDTDTRLALIEINLKNYRMSSISPNGLNELDHILSVWATTNKKLIVRFLYDWDGLALKSEPNNIDIIKEHMSQVGTIVNNHTSSIYILQGIFVGNCGEMNNSNYMSDESMVTLMNHLAKVTDPSIFLSVRTPTHWRQIASSFVPLTELDAHSNSLASRTGLFNDGMLGSGNDLGTYGSTSLSNATKYSDKGTRAEELAFQNQLCRYVPSGGEVVLDNPFNDLTSAISDLSTMHVSYLNNLYDANVLNKWKATKYNGTDVFNGCSGYDYVSNHLGYRYVLRSSSLTFQTFSNKYAKLSIAIGNVGFANTYQQFPVTILLKNTSTNEIISLPVDTDTRDWLSNEVTVLDLPLDVRTYGLGNYEIYLSMKDPNSGSSILFANNNYTDSLGYFLGKLSIKKFS